MEVPFSEIENSGVGRDHVSLLCIFVHVWDTY
jgi:hypothetical protein